MEDMLSFISQKIKNVEGLSMQQLISSIGFTRSKFYRFLQEPQRFSAKQLEALADSLGLDDKEKQILFQFNSGEKADDKNSINKILHKIVFDNPQFPIDRRSRLYTLYSSASNGTGMVRCSAEDLSALIRDAISQEKNNDRNMFHIRITNSCSYQKIQIIFNFLKSTLEIEDIIDNYHVSIQHIINSANMALEDKFQAFSDISCLFSLINYRAKIIDCDPSFLSNIDCCIIDFLDKNNVNVYLFIIFSSDTEALVYRFTDSNLFDFLTYNSFYSTLLFPDLSVLDDPIAINRAIIETGMRFQKIVILTNICYENYAPELWLDVKNQAKKDHTLLQTLKAYLDPKGMWKSYPDSLFLDMIYEGAIMRHYVAEEHAQINLLYTPALKSFAENGYTLEFALGFLSFTDQQVLTQLRYFRERIGDHAQEKKQSYYFIDLPYRNQKGLAIYEGHSFYLSYNEDPIIANQSFNDLVEPEMANTLFKYIIEELLPNSTRRGYTSLIMSDERAAEFLDSLIEKVKKRIEKAT